MITETPNPTTSRVFRPAQGPQAAPASGAAVRYAVAAPRASICRAPRRSNLARTVCRSRSTEVALEIGFGGGEAMIAQAQACPQPASSASSLSSTAWPRRSPPSKSKGLRNIRLHFDDAVELIAWLPEKSLARIDLIHPDPWPKRRHWKRRFVQDDMVAQLARILRPGGEFRFVTDIADYAAWTLQRLRARVLSNGRRRRPTIGAIPGRVLSRRVTTPRRRAKTAPRVF